MSKTAQMLEELEANNYIIDMTALSRYVEAVHQSAELSHNLKGKYFNILLAGVKGEIQNAEANAPLSIEGKLNELEKVSDKYLSIINQSLKTDAMTAQERNRATNFHRSAKSTIKKAIEAGHQVDDATIGKSALTKEANALITNISTVPERAQALLLKLSQLVAKMDGAERVSFEVEAQQFMDNTNWS